jgi:hypothetical protein
MYKYNKRLKNNSKFTFSPEILHRALCELQEDITFSNTNYGTVPATQGLILSDTVLDDVSWCRGEGPVTGTTPFLQCDLAYVLPDTLDSIDFDIKRY